MLGQPGTLLDGKLKNLISNKTENLTDQVKQIQIK